MPGSGSSMVVDKAKKKQNSVELEASLAPAKAEVGAVAKADKKLYCIFIAYTMKYSLV